MTRKSKDFRGRLRYEPYHQSSRLTHVLVPCRGAVVMVPRFMEPIPTPTSEIPYLSERTKRLLSGLEHGHVGLYLALKELAEEGLNGRNARMESDLGG
jgi:hypothetical protein